MHQIFDNLYSMGKGTISNNCNCHQVVTEVACETYSMKYFLRWLCKHPHNKIGKNQCVTALLFYLTWTLKDDNVNV